MNLIPIQNTYSIYDFHNRALEIIQDEVYLDESDFDEIKRQKRQINPWTPALIDNGVSSIKDENSLSEPQMTFYDHSTVMKTIIEAANHAPIWNETDESLDRKRRQLDFNSFNTSVFGFGESLDAFLDVIPPEVLESACANLTTFFNDGGSLQNFVSTTLENSFCLDPKNFPFTFSNFFASNAG